MPEHKWTADQVLVLMGEMEKLHVERDRRYQVEFDAQKERVRLAKEAADGQKGMVSIVGLVAVSSLILTLVGYFK